MAVNRDCSILQHQFAAKAAPAVTLGSDELILTAVNVLEHWLPDDADDEESLQGI